MLRTNLNVFAWSCFLACGILGGCTTPGETPAPAVAAPKAAAAAAQTADGQAAVQQPAEPTADKRPQQGPPLPGANGAEPEFITVQHILIGFQGSVPGKNITRTKAEAATLAQSIFEQAKSGAKAFDELVREHTDDAFPGVYSMANARVDPATLPPGTYHRGGMVAAFGDVGFPLQVGDVGLASFDSSKSPFGWHIIKRIK